MPSFYFNPTFEPVFSSNCRYKDIWGGRGRGGSHFGTDYFLMRLTHSNYFRGYFIRQTFSDIRDSLFRDIKDRIEENETINIKDFKINEVSCSLLYKPTGNTITSKGFSSEKKRTAKMKSIAGATHVLIEEADEIDASEFDQLDLSLRTIKAERVEIIRIFNPPQKAHWVWRDYNLTDEKVKIGNEERTLYRATPKSNTDILSIFSTYHDNIDNLQESTIRKFESFKETDIEYYCNQVLGMISEGAKGRIYSGWEMITDVEYNKLDLPKVYVIDFGYSDDPNAVLEVKYEKNYRYYRQLLYESGLDNVALARQLIALGITPNDMIIADSGAGGDLRIAELRRINRYADLGMESGFNIRATLKGPGSINVGINAVRSNRIFMTESSTDGWNEYREYKWALDADKNPTDTPVDKFNHLMDCARYFELCKGRYY